MVQFTLYNVLALFISIPCFCFISFHPSTINNVNAARFPANPQTRKPANPQTRKPANPQTRKPANPQTRKPANPQTRKPIFSQGTAQWYSAPLMFCVIHLHLSFVFALRSLYLSLNVHSSVVCGTG